VYPSSFLIRSRFPVVSLWGASAGSGVADDVDMSRPEDGLVLRPGEEVVTVSLPEGGAEFLIWRGFSRLVDHVERARIAKPPPHTRGNF
jgi:hypothetical protein